MQLRHALEIAYIICQITTNNAKSVVINIFPARNVVLIVRGCWGGWGVKSPKSILFVFTFPSSCYKFVSLSGDIIHNAD